MDTAKRILDQGFVQVSQAAEVSKGKTKKSKRKKDEAGAMSNTPQAQHETLAIDLNIAESGYLYTYVSNESNWDVDVHFDQMQVQAVAAQPTVVQSDDFYPYGMSFQQQPGRVLKNKYLYNGKELQEETGWYDFGARMYDPALGRWMSPDPLSDQFPSHSVYNYALNNPIRFIDPDGQAPFDPNCPGCPTNDEFANALATDVLSVKHSLYNMLARPFGYEATFTQNEAGNYETGFVKTNDDFLTAAGKYALDALSVGTFGRGGGPNAFLAKTPAASSLSNSVKNVLKQFSRDGDLGGTVNLLEGNSKKGLQHILERHSADEFTDVAKGDLFPTGTTSDQIFDAIGDVYSRGTRVSDPGKAVQTFERRTKINGETGNYRLIVDQKNQEVVTFFKMGGKQ